MSKVASLSFSAKKIQTNTIVQRASSYIFGNVMDLLYNFFDQNHMYLLYFNIQNSSRIYPVSAL